MTGHSYFNYDQMTIFEVEVHSDELELLKGVADEYDWGTIEEEVEPLFKEAARDFRNRNRNFVCPRKKDEEEKDLQEAFPFLDEIEPTAFTAGRISTNRNPKGAGRKGQDFISYLKAFELSPVIRVEQNSEAIAGALASNPAFYVACGFISSCCKDFEGF